MADFDDGKEDGALRTIGEVSEALDIKPHVLRYWEQQFSLLKPLKRSGGRRYYREEDVEMIETINRLVNEEGYTLKGAESVLRSSGSGDADRRAGDRRSGADGAGEAQAGGQASGAADVGAAVLALKSIRGRLVKALES
ncbi:MerR family transcriptional regulator [Erythrobacter rubeus]|uniref:MerR family transcriptional regulator n=1 Tax=Erythrobacter rubeus TaxID=2760803 RepID=A0ABR8KQ55_9SPHN|nr:MerR family transcriptional regulator [Erythrobacter rubeus]MBD2841333.1 MerR family transcriptional regulator [Erythrobacter rubeus]